ncbi:uncharacterized membrane protein YebE (DUF533 family) [Microvirga flocculans]|uniref:Uncharacterized membrane protein YebE (DUF533 family) n=1 Tax=Microvirga flocculans TaxID=217168 RepID=A0A7W6N909_9HYPH|nr:tellurite resistance TerB family protein [Microvirga flocculans]MBB4041010.1 uncharacterized membrane protein YebE (DUF533 family) [Microvirga flocculans]
MVDYRKLLDAFVGAIGRADHSRPDQPASDGFGRQVERGVTQVTGQSPEQLLQKARDFATRHPGVTQTALLGLAGLLFGRRKKGRLTGDLVRLGGLAVIGGLAYRAFQNREAVQATAEGGAAPALTPVSQDEAVAQSALGLPETSRFHPVSQTEDDTLLFLRTMVAAAAADGHIDRAERARIVKGLIEAGIDPDSTRWLENEMASPADVEELAAGVNDPEMAAQVYAAARIAIDPDTIQEREFLHRLAEALDLDPAVRAQIDETAAELG